MGTASFSVGTYGKNASRAVTPSEGVTSGAHTSSGTASNLSDGSDIIMASGQLLQVHASVAMRIRFGGTAATITTGHYIPAGEQREFECNAPGAVSIIDV